MITAAIDRKANTLTVTVPLNPPRPSATGKTLVIASTAGNVKPAGLEFDGRPVTVGVNAYIASA